MINTQAVQKIRQQTGAGIMDITKALAEADGDENKALALLKKMGQKIAKKKQAERGANEGIIEAYVHANSKIASLVMLACETDFVTKNEEFKNLAHNIAMQIAAMNPKDVPSLLEQNFIKDDGKTIKDLIDEYTVKLGEKIEVKKIVRFSL